MPARPIDAHPINDADWIKQSFMMDPSSIQDLDYAYRTLSSANFSFSDTTPGGNAAINPPPQFTRYADIKVGGLGAYQAAGVFNPEMSRGKGRYYHEAIDENAVHCYMRFGLPQYNSLTNFFNNFYSAEAAAMARTGRGTSIFYKAGAVVGFVVGIVPRALVFMGNVAGWFRGKQASKYYYLKPAMPVYWNTVTTIVNSIAVNMGVIPPLVGDNPQFTNDSPDRNTDGYTSKEINAALHAMLPEIFREDGGIDVYALANRYHRLEMAYQDAGYKAVIDKTSRDAGNTPGDIELLRRALGDFQQTAVSMPPSAIEALPTTASDTDANGVKTQKRGLDAYIAAYMSVGSPVKPSAGDAKTDTYFQQAIDNGPADANSTANGDKNPPSTNPADSGTTGESIMGDDNIPWGESYYNDFFHFQNAELQDGGAFVSFRVDGSGTAGESFSNSVKESEIQNKINSMSASNRETRFSLEGGNLSDSHVVNFLEGAAGAVKDFVFGAVDKMGINISGLSALAGNAFVDIPKTWDSSSANLPRMDFTIQLRTPYGNKMSRLLHLYIPLAMLLAGALPLSTGRQSYTSPFICEAYCRGRMACRLGMIDSLSITRGTGNVGWTNEGEPLGIDVSFSIVDLSSVMFMPTAANFSLGQAVTMEAGKLIGEGTAVTAESLGSILTGTSGDLSGAAASGAKAGEATAASLMPSTWDDDNTYTDYMAVLGSLTLYDQVAPMRRWKLRITRQAAQFKSWTSMAHATSWLGGTWFGRTLSMFVPTARRGSTGA